MSGVLVVASQRARKEIATKLRLDGLPRRPVYAEVGSIELPRFVHTWLKNSRGQFTIADLGMLTSLLLMFENQESLFIGGRFETIDGEPVLILREEQLRFPRSMNNDAMTTGHSGFVREKMALRTLVRNEWFEVERPAGVADQARTAGEEGQAGELTPCDHAQGA